MKSIEAEVARRVKAMTRAEVVLKAMQKQITWIQAAMILGVTDRHMRRLKSNYERHGFGCLRDHSHGRTRRRKIPLEVVRELCRLRRLEGYRDMSARHFWEFATERHGLKLSYKWALLLLQEAGLADKAEGRGHYRRKRERRPMRGMLLHCDGSTHAWIEDIPKRDLIVILDDADGHILHAQFVEQEGTVSTLAGLKEVLRVHGRFCEFYHDRGSHFGRTSKAGQGPDEEQKGQVTRVLNALGITQIFARSPQARGRSERCFGTVQGRLPQELKLRGITDYDEANAYLRNAFIADFNRRFGVEPLQKESAFIPLVGIDLDMLASVHHTRKVSNDNTVAFKTLCLQLPKFQDRAHLVRYCVQVHELTDGSLAISLQGKLLARYNAHGELRAQATTVAA
jgi:hypothetical protein